MVGTDVSIHQSQSMWIEIFQSKNVLIYVSVSFNTSDDYYTWWRFSEATFKILMTFHE